MLSDNAGTSLPVDASHNVQIQYGIEELTSWLLLHSTLPIFFIFATQFTIDGRVDGSPPMTYRHTSIGPWSFRFTLV